MFGVFITTITKGHLNMMVKMLNQIFGGVILIRFLFI
jgi:hypothetical protein